MLIMANKKTPKNAEHFGCEHCDFKCSKKSDWDRHLLTNKHLNANNANIGVADIICSGCSQKFKHASSLSRHKKKCGTIEENGVMKELMKENNDFKSLMLEMMKNNTDLQNKMLELCKNGNMNNNTINSHNKSFNMQFFLNEQCKDAMNIKDFIDSFQLQFADLERVGELGYVDGISDIIIKKLNEMDIYKRPIHCSDTKRDIMYVRAENVWEKETNSHDRLHFLIRQVTHKNIKLIPLWAATHPQARDNEHPLNETYLGMVGQAMGGRSDLEESENKIIKRIAKTVYIDKY